MAISPADVKKLRDMTSAGMLDCKKALIEANGDFAEAEKILKKKGMASAAKRSDRATNQGRIFTKITDSKSVMLELTCETDFVSRNEGFIKAGEDMVDAIIDNGYTEMNDALGDMVKATIGTLKENMALKRFDVVDIADNEVVVDYIHGDGAIGVLVKLAAEDAAGAANADVKQFAFDCALHIAAYNPTFMTKDDVDPAYLKEQEEIFAAQAAAMGKPEKVVAGIVKGKLNKHLTEICFMNQAFVKNDKLTVEKAMDEVAKAAGTKLSLGAVKYYRVGVEA